ncbi:MAG: hypothetical protein WBQ25_20140 [Nitrososphaeraceae archaeon]
MKKEVVAGIGIVVLVAIMILGIFMSWWPLNSVLLNVIPYFIAAGIIGLFVWGFRDKINNRFSRNDIKLSPLSVEEVIIPKEKMSEPKPLITQQSIKNGIQHYENRSQLPFNEMLYKAEGRIEMLAITFRIVTYANYDVLKGLLSRKVHITFLLSNPDSSSIEVQSKMYHGGEDIKEQIQGSLEILCKLKNEFKDLVRIRLYDSISQHSIIIIDRDNADKAWIYVESRPVGSDSSSRPSDVTYLKANQAFFNRYCSEYDMLLDNSEPYECLSASSL